MRVIDGIDILGGALLSSTIAEPDAGEPALWSAVTTYAEGDRTIRAQTHRIYVALANTTPNLDKVPEAEEAFWAEVGPTNRAAMFDGRSGTTSTAAESLVIEVAASYADSLSLRGLVGTQLDVTVRNGAGGPVLRSYSMSLQGRQVYGWRDYFFGRPSQRSEVNLLDLPPRSAGHITIEVSGPGDVAVGDCAIGRTFDFGAAEFGLTAPLSSDAQIEDDGFGIQSLRQGRVTRDLNVTFIVPHALMPQVMDVAARQMNRVSVWIGADGDVFTWTTTRGVLQSFDPAIQHATETVCNAKIEGFF